MKPSALLRLGLMTLFLWVTCVPGFAYQGPAVASSPSSITTETKANSTVSVAPPFPITPPFPFEVGETLTYDFKFSRFPLFGSLGQLEMSIVPPEPLPENAIASNSSSPSASFLISRPLLAFRAVVESRGFFPSLLGLKVKDTFYSAVDAQDLGNLYAQKDIDEGKRKRQQVSIFYREKTLLQISDTDLTAAKPVPTTRTVDSRPWTSDLLSFWYVLRTQPLQTGHVIPMVVCEDGKTYNVDVEVQKSEKISLDVGKFPARRLLIKAYEAQFVRIKGEYLLWISDDAARLPLRVRFRTDKATVTGELVKLRRPVKSETVQTVKK